MFSLFAQNDCRLFSPAVECQGRGLRARFAGIESICDSLHSNVAGIDFEWGRVNYAGGEHNGKVGIQRLSVIPTTDNFTYPDQV